MIFGIGTDICDCVRMENAIKRSEGFKNKIFTQSEQDYCDGNAITFQHYAARFAAKEAFLKALGTGWRFNLGLTEIEVWNDNLEKPCIKVSGEVEKFCNEHNIKHIHLSLSHEKEYALAFVILESE